MVERALLFNTIPPFLFEEYERAGVEPVDFAQLDHFARHGHRADDLLRELDSPARRREYVSEVYGEAGWTGVVGFSAGEQAFMSEPFAGEDALRNSISSTSTPSVVRRQHHRGCSSEILRRPWFSMAWRTPSFQLRSSTVWQSHF
jgi:hypothetical protein